MEGEALVVARLREVDEVAHGDRQLVLELRTREKQYRLIHAVRGVVGSEARHIRAQSGARGSGRTLGGTSTRHLRRVLGAKAGRRF